MWFNDCVFYQIYPLTLLGAPKNNPDLAEERERQNSGTDLHAENPAGNPHRLLRLKDWAPYLKDLGVGGLYLNPVNDSDSHGYDTRDYRKTDPRLGTNEDLGETVKVFHENGIRVVLDGVFNHTGRGFFAFLDVKKNREKSPYAGWFNLNFGGDSPYGDGFWYEGWEGHYELVKLNLGNPEVRNYLLDSLTQWFHDYDIDGIRLDVAYLLPTSFIAEIKARIRSLKPDAFLLGEILGDNAGKFYTEGQADAITDYPGYKGLWSAVNSFNLFELAHTVKRNYDEMYRGRQLFSFADNHDVERIASRLTDPEELRLVYGLLLTLPGIPCIYYGSEWGTEGKKENGSDDSLRPCFEKPQPNALTAYIRKVIALRNRIPALQTGSYRVLELKNRSFAFERELDGERHVIRADLDRKEVTLDGTAFS